MSDEDRPSDSVLASLGIDVDSVDIPVLDDVWQAMLEVAFDPSTPDADSSVVPVMDDDGDLPDDGSHDVDPAVHETAFDHDSPSDHHGDDIVLEPDHDADQSHHDPATDGSLPDHGDDHHHGQGDHDWHV